jgi:B12-binding domain/radical SAM domain protein
MRKTVRFTFVCDRSNRTAVASLIASLEDQLQDINEAVRVVDPDEAPLIEFSQSEKHIDVLCMSSMTEGFPDTARLLNLMRGGSCDTRFISVCGGPHATGDPRGVLEAGFDYCCVGEGEEVVRDVVNRLTVGESLEGVDGIFTLDDGVLKGRMRSRWIDLDRYRPLPGRLRFLAYIEIGRGCQWGCAYCQTPGIFGRSERFRSPERIEQTVSLYAQLGMRYFRLLAPNALGYCAVVPGIPNCESLEEILRRVKSASRDGRIYLGSFPSEVRPDYMTEEAVLILKRYVTNRRLVIGAQTGSQRMLDVIGRGHGIEDIRQASQIVAACGFEPAIDIMLGLPGEASEDRKATFDLIRELGESGARVNMHFFIPLAGTPLAGCAPTFLTDKERKTIDRLAQEGIVRGRWRRQEQFAKRWVLQREGKSPSQ